MMSKNYEVTATRRRPKSFNTMLGQEFVASAISNSINNNRIAHAYLFAGPRGVGKTSSARILAKSLNCMEGPTATPCGKCTNCLEIAAGSSLDVIEIDGASNTGVGDVREIKDEVLFPPTSSKYKIYIIDEVHMLSLNAFNALLKTIEEPPEYIIFIFATTETHKVPATIKSRCQQFNFRLIDVETVKNALREAAVELGIEADDEALFWVAKEGGGSMRDAYTLFDQAVAFSDGHITLAKIREKMGLANIEELNELISACAGGRQQEAFDLLSSLISKGLSIEQLLTDMAEYFRSMLYIKNGIEKESVLGIPVGRFAGEPLESFSLSQIEVALEAIFKLYREIRYSINSQFEFELLISRLCRLKDVLRNEDIVHSIQAIKNSMGAGEKKNLTEAPPSLSAQATAAPEPQIRTAVTVSEDKPKPSASSAVLSYEWDGQTSSLKKELVRRVKAVQPLLSVTIEQADWQLEENELQMLVDKAFDHKAVSDQTQLLEQQLKQLIDQDITVKPLIKAAEQTQLHLEPEVEKILEIFHGEIIQ